MKSNHSAKKNVVFLATGSNLGDRKKRLEKARALISKQIGHLTQASSLYETAPWGNTSQPVFYNQVLKVETKLSPHEVMQEILHIETAMGRIRTFKYAPRVIDIDILLYDEKVIHDNDVIIPHPYLHERNFVLAPLQEIAPDQVHPVLIKTIRELARECSDLKEVKRLEVESF